ncbi:isocitrate lyase/phosphoenolpyruvate mutase family protein [Deinococcus metallilatus]|uniref:Methylisocitrate lyase n=1 Tax=Deinococcus metallilatus TaxID=1211322 RepID=A0ABR6MUW5_9DEIO|nr:isocitrate lyase/phosphoenolpyruvate mutase family protein [Deinococcus metallilatus]MBB5295710.1 methylisocitrate lyase [Deinococcus metallilatus]GMA14241.1 hypothetical protein GCM10025871_05720 [Deinococcus metallilatus]
MPGQPLVLFNIWDVGSAAAVTASGAQALASGSWSVAHALGFSDGERTPLDLAIENLKRIVAATDLPVSVDLESGYQDIAQTVQRALEDQVERLRRARGAAGDPVFINARTDVFFQKPTEEHDAAMLHETLERARAYADAGANGLFAPGLSHLSLIARLA